MDTMTTFQTTDDLYVSNITVITGSATCCTFVLLVSLEPITFPSLVSALLSLRSGNTEPVTISV